MRAGSRRHACSECGRPVVARRSKGRRGVVRPKGDHDLCQKCWKSHNDRVRVRKMKTLEEALRDVNEALAPLPDGYRIETHNGNILVINGNFDLAFCITPLTIKDNMHINVAKTMFSELIKASPVEGHA